MYSLRRKLLSQNFLYSRKLVNKLLRQSSIAPDDTVLEIGPGKGIITEQLLLSSKKVIAVELDTHLCTYLFHKFKNHPHLHLINKNVLKYKLPVQSYKVFANIPFSLEGKIIRKLLNAPIPPQDSYLVMREDVAKRLCGYKKECQFSISYKPWFAFEVVHHFKRTDFTPFAGMDAVLLRFTKQEYPLLNEDDKKSFMIFVGQGFGGGKNLKHNLRIFFTSKQFSKLARKWGFPIQSSPSHLLLDQWIGLYLYAIQIGKMI